MQIYGVNKLEGKAKEKEVNKCTALLKNMNA